MSVIATLTCPAGVRSPSHPTHPCALCPSTLDSPFLSPDLRLCAELLKHWLLALTFEAASSLSRSHPAPPSSAPAPSLSPTPSCTLCTQVDDAGGRRALTGAAAAGRRPGCPCASRPQAPSHVAAVSCATCSPCARLPGCADGLGAHARAQPLSSATGIPRRHSGKRCISWNIVFAMGQLLAWT